MRSLDHLPSPDLLRPQAARTGLCNPPTRLVVVERRVPMCGKPLAILPSGPGTGVRSGGNDIPPSGLPSTELEEGENPEVRRPC